MNSSEIPMSERKPARAPLPAPTAAPSKEFMKIIPINIPQKVPPTAPAAVRLAAWCYLSVVVSRYNNDVFHIDEIFLLHFRQRGTHLKSRMLIVKSNDD
jgi:hypothetical protein